ncbi:MAG: acyl-CoA acyltransferase [Methylovirgula sp.]|uniref:acyl-CoA acyltransferase n=1 Tax=Methylovirgula sp. TaxID=1978224 RepID=UPI0030765572
MVNAVSSVRPATLACREIDEADLSAIADLLTRGFPGRNASYWLTGFTRMAALALPPGYPRFGYMMENDGKPVGVILLLYRQMPDETGAGYIHCNLSSWYVEPSMRSYASMLVSFALKRPEVTYINISPAPPTWPVVEAQGFKRFSEGQFFAFPALSSKGFGLSVVKVPSAAEIDVPAAERAILADHARFGCLTLVCHTKNGDLPFVFAPFSIRAGRMPLPFMRLIYCRDMADFLLCAGALGRYLLRHGVLSVLLDVKDMTPPLPGIYSTKLGRKYFKGPHPPCLGDLAYSEYAVFGP